jgi:hypothetical protein
METAIETVAEAASAAEKQLEKTIGAVAEEVCRHWWIPPPRLSSLVLPSPGHPAAGVTVN